MPVTWHTLDHLHILSGATEVWRGSEPRVFLAEVLRREARRWATHPSGADSKPLGLLGMERWLGRLQQGEAAWLLGEEPRTQEAIEGHGLGFSSFTFCWVLVGFWVCFGAPLETLKVKNQNDGLFYMSFADFEKLYTGCQLCPVGTKPLPNDEDLEEDVGEEESKGFLSSMFGSFWWAPSKIWADMWDICG